VVHSDESGTPARQHMSRDCFPRRVALHCVSASAT
jgi:hypothetical protein